MEAIEVWLVSCIVGSILIWIISLVQQKILLNELKGKKE